ncbi:VOC family protein [Shewanella sp. 10N.286.52.B9]|uniref:VOC family protein n=1 Tax=Shewanella sp. 10N.286.52.B9 TaxID=1880837 RepID=UPI000C82F38A|nr:VOC family protein [Shewanella sp. 10N.286.52.B9]PMG52353.1 glyoxalase [Shewanella sp. 10N.286.52.B9]
MMRLEHLNLVVQNLDASLAFYRAAFPHWQVRGGGEGEWHGVQRKWLHFGDEYNYLSLNDGGKGKMRPNEGYDLGLAHFAYVVSDLKSLMARMEQAGFEIAIKGREDTYSDSIYYLDPDGIEVEFVQYLTDIPSERNRYV